jgi:hypothetical protein
MGELTEFPDTEIAVQRRALDGLRGDLPKTWEWRVEEDLGRGGVRFDALVTLRAPGGQTATLAVETKRLVATRDVSLVLEQLRASVSRAKLSDTTPLVVARYLSPAARERLEREGAAYADATGNRRLALERPALFLRNVGEDRDPWRGPGRPRGTLQGAPAGKVVRWLVDVMPPYTPLQIAKSSGVSTGATYRVISFLDEEGLVRRQPKGPITAVDWRPLLERWSQDSGFQRSGPVSLLFPRGVEALVETLRSSPDLRYALTGSLAARHYEAHATPRFAMLYADNVEAAIERLGLRRIDAGANVLIAPDRDGVAFVRTREVERVRLAAPSQIAVDLLTGPGRSPAEGAALLDWMEAHERDWRA